MRPVAVDLSPAQIENVERLQLEFGFSFRLICANAEAVPFDELSFDVAVSESRSRPPKEAKARFDFVSVEWARRWPSEEIWIAREVS